MKKYIIRFEKWIERVKISAAGTVIFYLLISTTLLSIVVGFIGLFKLIFKT